MKITAFATMSSSNGDRAARLPFDQPEGRNSHGLDMFASNETLQHLQCQSSDPRLVDGNTGKRGMNVEAAHGIVADPEECHVFRYTHARAGTPLGGMMAARVPLPQDATRQRLLPEPGQEGVLLVSLPGTI